MLQRGNLPFRLAEQVAAEVEPHRTAPGSRIVEAQAALAALRRLEQTVALPSSAEKPGGRP